MTSFCVVRDGFGPDTDFLSSGFKDELNLLFVL